MDKSGPSTSTFKEDHCAMEKCVRSGKYKVKCYVCDLVFHTGCVGVSDLNYKSFRCLDCIKQNSVKSPPSPERTAPSPSLKSKRNKYKVSCTDCKKTFFFYDDKNPEIEQFYCIRCFTNKSSSDDAMEETSSSTVSPSASPNTSTGCRKRRNKIFCKVCNKGYYFSEVKDLDFNKFLCIKCLMNKSSSDTE